MILHFSGFSPRIQGSSNQFSQVASSCMPNIFKNPPQFRGGRVSTHPLPSGIPESMVCASHFFQARSILFTPIGDAHPGEPSAQIPRHPNPGMLRWWVIILHNLLCAQWCRQSTVKGKCRRKAIKQFLSQNPNHIQQAEVLEFRQILCFWF